MGRVKLSEEIKRSEVIAVRTTKKEKEIIEIMAKKKKMKLSEYVLSKIM